MFIFEIWLQKHNIFIIFKTLASVICINNGNSICQKYSKGSHVEIKNVCDLGFSGFTATPQLPQL